MNHALLIPPSPPLPQLSWRAQQALAAPAAATLAVPTKRGRTPPAPRLPASASQAAAAVQHFLEGFQQFIHETSARPAPSAFAAQVACWAPRVEPFTPPPLAPEEEVEAATEKAAARAAPGAREAASPTKPSATAVTGGVGRRAAFVIERQGAPASAVLEALSRHDDKPSHLVRATLEAGRRGLRTLHHPGGFPVAPPTNRGIFARKKTVPRFDETSLLGMAPAGRRDNMRRERGSGREGKRPAKGGSGRGSRKLGVIYGEDVLAAPLGDGREARITPAEAIAAAEAADAGLAALDEARVKRPRMDDHASAS